ncbi:hypothetical protein [Larkinella ripae]
MAKSISFCPCSVIKPPRVSRSTRSRLLLLQWLVGLRGENRW